MAGLEAEGASGGAPADDARSGVFTKEKGATEEETTEYDVVTDEPVLTTPAPVAPSVAGTASGPEALVSQLRVVPVSIVGGDDRELFRRWIDADGVAVMPGGKF